jgi:Tol biopolymer transport system component/DNA-binding winged helix-turn-helix (wHTH) protein
MSHLYEFGPFRLDPGKRELRRLGEPLSLRPKAFDTLLALVEQADSLVTKDALMARVWPDTVVEEGGLARNISELRKALGERPGEQRYIATLPGHGYRLIAPVLVIPASTATDPPHVRSARQAPSALWLAAAAVALLAAVGAVGLVGSRGGSRKVPFETISVARLTHSGKSLDAAISPDGEHVAHVIEESDQQSLWVRQVASGQDVPVVPPAPVEYWGLTIAPDGRHIYYTVWDTRSSEAGLFRVPLLGGSPSRVLTDIDGPPALSPDGRRVSYVVNKSSRGESWLMVAVIGGAPAILARRHQPETFLLYPAGPAWSPDGRTIALGAGGSDIYGRFTNVVEVDAQTGRETPVSSVRWPEVERLAWLQGGRSLLIATNERPGAPRQLWRVSRPGGIAARVTHDVNDYGGVSVAADGHTLVTVQREQRSRLFILPAGRFDSLSLVRVEVGTRDGRDGLAWTPDGRIVFTTNTAGSVDLWVTDARGTAPRPLVAGAGMNIHPTVCADGTVVFASDRGGTFNLWTVRGDGASLRPITAGRGEWLPQCARDGRSVVFQSGYGGGTPMHIARIPMEGGTPSPLTGSASMAPALSPDGQRIAYYSFADDKLGWRVAVSPAEGGSPLRTFSLPATGASRIVRFGPDGRSLVFIGDRDGNLWTQPLEGRAPRRLTSLPPERTFSFDFSRHGDLAMARGQITSDVVRIRDAR